MDPTEAITRAMRTTAPDSYADQREAKQSRAATRADRHATWARNATRRAEAAFDGARAAVESIPLGQPILVGHHSERRHRAALARQDSRMRRAIEETKTAEHHRHRAAAAERTASTDYTPAFCQRRIADVDRTIRDLDRRIAHTTDPTRADLYGTEGADGYRARVKTRRGHRATPVLDRAVGGLRRDSAHPRHHPPRRRGTPALAWLGPCHSLQPEDGIGPVDGRPTHRHDGQVSVCRDHRAPHARQRWRRTMTPQPRKRRPPSGYAVAYRRVSTDEQAQSGLGLEAQTAAIEQAARRANLSIRATFTEAGVSGGLPIDKRPELVAALSALRRGDVLLIAKRDRLARDLINVALIEAAAARKGARIISAAGEGTDSDSPADKLMRMMIDAFASYERLVIGARTSAALRAKASRGERVSGEAPYGYRFETTGEQTARGKPISRIVEDAPELAMIAVMHDCQAAGFSLDAIARELNRLGHTTRSGQPWKKQYVANVLQRHTPPSSGD
jgi:DNA invertase Pin-like site-specific DNA recombinase